jgi:hypothetical protein
MKRTHVAVQRATAFARLLPMIEELGSSPAAALAGTGLSINDLKPDGFIPYRAALAFLENAAAMTGREDLGLRLGDQQNLASLGPLGEAMFHAKTLGEALADFTHPQPFRSSTRRGRPSIFTGRTTSSSSAMASTMQRTSYRPRCTTWCWPSDGV